MSFTTYAELQTTIAGYLARSDLTTQIPDFIRLAEIRLRRDLRIRQMLNSTTLTCTSGTATVSIPSDFLEVKDFVVTGNPVYWTLSRHSSFPFCPPPWRGPPR